MAHMRLKSRLRPLLIVLAVILCAPGNAAFAGELTATVDRTSISVEETMQLTLRYNEQVGFGGPDFTQLEQDFDILSNNRSNQFRSINGRAESWTQWQLMLAPKRTGKLFIPSFSYEGNFSDAIEITVAAGDNAPSGQVKELFLETEVSKPSAYVQEQLLFTVRLYTAVNLRGINSEELELPGAITTQLAEHRYQRRINGRAFGVVEVIYAIHPQQSGELVIPSLVYDVTLSARSRDPWSDPFGSRGGAMKRLRSEGTRLQIKPQPGNYNGKQWLPAQDLQLQQDWSADLKNFKVGEPITRVLTLTAKGLTAAQLPPLSVENSPGIKLYPDQPQNQDQKMDAGVTGIRTETMAIVPTQSGELTLPEVAVTWWDTERNEQRVARLPATTVTVAPGAIPALPGPTTAQLPVADGPTPAAPTPVASPPARPWFWIGSTGFFALLSAGLALALFRANHQSPSASEAAGRNQTILQTEKRAFKQLKRVCREGDPAAVRQAYLNWVKAYWPDRRVHSLQASLMLINDGRLSECLAQLDGALYGDKAQGAWHGQDLIAQLEAWRAHHQADKVQKVALQPLYPSEQT